MDSWLRNTIGVAQHVWPSCFRLCLALSNLSGKQTSSLEIDLNENMATQLVLSLSRLHCFFGFQTVIILLVSPQAAQLDIHFLLVYWKSSIAAPPRGA